jgi:hypothetical protein
MADAQAGAEPACASAGSGRRLVRNQSLSSARSLTGKGNYEFEDPELESKNAGVKTTGTSHRSHDHYFFISNDGFLS